MATILHPRFFQINQIVVRHVGDGERAVSRVRELTRDLTPEKRGAFNRLMQHHLKDLLLKDGVYERREPIETFSRAENGYLEPLEGRGSRCTGRDDRVRSENN